jgi:hypothetical protein
MEGPQSNADVQLYREMAAKVGDRTVPAVERQAALRTLKGLQEKYREQNQQKLEGAPANPSPAPTPSPSTDRKSQPSRALPSASEVEAELRRRGL